MTQSATRWAQTSIRCREYPKEEGAQAFEMADDTYYFFDQTRGEGAAISVGYFPSSGLSVKTVGDPANLSRTGTNPLRQGP